LKTSIRLINLFKRNLKLSHSVGNLLLRSHAELVSASLTIIELFASKKINTILPSGQVG